MDKKVLLIADDEEMNRRIISKFLKNNFDIIEAENGKVAMDIIKEQHVDAMLLDIIMPEMDGLEVLEAMRADSQYDHIGVLVATSTKEKTERAALSLGADDVVSKPYDPVVIRKRFDNIMTVKEMNVQKMQLQNKEIDSYIQGMDHAAMTDIRDVAEKITRLTDILNQNTENAQLAEEIAADIREQAENIIKRIDEGK